MANAAQSQVVTTQAANPVQRRIAPYANRSSLFLFGAIALIVANLALSPQGWAALSAIVPLWSQATPPKTSPTSVLDLFGQIIIMFALLVIGSVSDDGATFALVFLAALWLAFLYSHRDLFTGLMSKATPPASSGGGPSSNTNSAWRQ